MEGWVLSGEMTLQLGKKWNCEMKERAVRKKGNGREEGQRFTEEGQRPQRAIGGGAALSSHLCSSWKVRWPHGSGGGKEEGRRRAVVRRYQSSALSAAGLGQRTKDTVEVD